jgi:Domain of Unknown Function (DUF1206)
MSDPRQKYDPNGQRLRWRHLGHPYRVTVAREAGSVLQRTEDNPWFERLTRFGLVGYGVLHILLAWIALQLAFGKAPAVGDQSGAFATLGRQPAGRAILIAMAIGLIAMAVWQAIEAAIGHRNEQGKRRTAERVGSGARTVVYAALAFTAFRTVTGSARTAADTQQKATSDVLSHAGGQWLVGLAGVVVTAVGIGLAVYGIKREFERNLRSDMPQKARRPARWLGTVGYVAKGAAYAIVGLLVVTAAVSYDPARSRGLDQALRTLAAQPFGRLLLILVALGIGAYGVYCFFQARWRKI